MTREEAIECIRGFMKQLTEGCREAIITTIPELRESEDERMMTWLITQLKTNYKGDYWASKAIEYLEKQSAKWSEEDENMLTGIIERGSSQIPFGELALRKEQLEWLMNKFKFLHSQPRDYAITFWTYLDEHKPEGKMCLSNRERADIEKAFIEHDWAKILRYAKKYLSSKELIEGDRIIERKVGMHGEPIEIVLDEYAQKARGIFPGDELTIILRTKR